MAEINTKSANQPVAASQPHSGGFPDPSITLIEFSDALGILLAGRTERDAENRRLALKKVAYIRIEPHAWGATALPEVWIKQGEGGLFMAVEPKTGRVFKHPSRVRYEVAFLSKNLFDCSIQCLKQKQPGPLYELLLVSFAQREGFSVEAGCLLAPDAYANERNLPGNAQWMPPPPPIS